MASSRTSGLAPGSAHVHCVQHRSQIRQPRICFPMPLHKMQMTQTRPLLPRHLKNAAPVRVSVAVTTEAPVSAGNQEPAATPTSSPEPAAPVLWQRNWVPVSPVDYLDPSRPNAVMLLGQPLVVWHHATHGWKAMRDMCPHRLAPLSEGRLEAGGTRLACAYHGWEFSETGSCARIPQLANDERASATACASPRSCVTSFPTLLHDGLLFAWLDSSKEGLAAAQAASKPYLVDPKAKAFVEWTTQEVPNDYRSWAEQAFDPSHANFLHHGVSGFKEDNFLPMPAQTLDAVSDIDLVRGFTWEHGAYEKKQAGMTAYRTFVPPFTNRFVYQLPNGQNTHFCTMVVPVRSGVCRTYFKGGLTFGPLGPNPTQPPVSPAPAPTPSAAVAEQIAGAAAAAKPAEPSGAAGSGGLRGLMFSLVSKLPHWVFGNPLLGDQDVIMMTGLEAVMRRNGLTPKDYVLNAPADMGVTALRSWLDLANYPASLWTGRQAAAGGISPSQSFSGWPEQELPLEKILDRWDRHVAFCAVCRRGMRLVTRVCWGLTLASGLAAVAAVTMAVVAALGGVQTAAATGAAAPSWAAVGGAAVAAAVLAVAAVKAWEFREVRFVNSARQWRRINGFPGFKMPKA